MNLNEGEGGLKIVNEEEKKCVWLKGVAGILIFYGFQESDSIFIHLFLLLNYSKCLL